MRASERAKLTGRYATVVDKDDKVERLWSYANNYEVLSDLGYGKTEVKAVPSK